jgi:transcriptional regulator with XRE-family HTH domain
MSSMGEKPLMITGKQVRAARNLLGWSQMKLAVKAELAFQTIAEVETRKKNVPKRPPSRRYREHWRPPVSNSRSFGLRG